MIRLATAADALQLSENMREADKMEALALAGASPLEALTMGLIHSDVCICYEGHDGSPVAMAGVVDHGNEIGSPWFICSEAVVNNRRALAVMGRTWVDHQMKRYKVLWNVVMASNAVHIETITHMGFSFKDPIENYGPGRVTALPFERKR